MQPRIPGFAALISLVFLVASDLVVAQITAPNCSDSWKWSYNSLNQNPCKVGAYLMSNCSGGTYNLSPLQQGDSYPPAGPTTCNEVPDPCMCNNVVYNLLSACDGCQGQKWAAWSEYSSTCETLEPDISTFTYPVPADTRVPQWALVDTTSGSWNATTAKTVGDLPELRDGGIVGPPSARASTVTTSATASIGAPTASSSVITPNNNSSVITPSNSFKKSSKTGAIAGGVTGGVVALAFIGGLVFYSLRQRPHLPDGPYQLLKRTGSKMS